MESRAHFHVKYERCFFVQALGFFCTSTSQVKFLTPIIHTRKQVSKFKETQRKTQK